LSIGLNKISQRQLGAFPEWENFTSSDQIGNEYMDRLIQKEIPLLQRCIDGLGEDGCILSSPLPPQYLSHRGINLMLRQSIYVVFIRQALKFIDKVCPRF
jgi:hypothetical protein